MKDYTGAVVLTMYGVGVLMGIAMTWIALIMHRTRYLAPGSAIVSVALAGFATFSAVDSDVEGGVGFFLLAILAALGIGLGLVALLAMNVYRPRISNSTLWRFLWGIGLIGVSLSARQHASEISPSISGFLLIVTLIGAGVAAVSLPSVLRMILKVHDTANGEP